MAKFRIEIKRSAVKEINKLVKKDLKLVLKAVDKLRENPRPYGSIKLSGDDIYRIRAGDYRILYEIADDLVIVIIVKVGHRREIYR